MFTCRNHPLKYYDGQIPNQSILASCVYKQDTESGKYGPVLNF